MHSCTLQFKVWPPCTGMMSVHDIVLLLFFLINSCPHYAHLLWYCLASCLYANIAFKSSQMVQFMQPDRACPRLDCHAGITWQSA